MKLLMLFFLLLITGTSFSQSPGSFTSDSSFVFYSEGADTILLKHKINITGSKVQVLNVSTNEFFDFDIQFSDEIILQFKGEKMKRYIYSSNNNNIKLVVIDDILGDLDGTLFMTIFVEIDDHTRIIMQFKMYRNCKRAKLD